MPGCLLCICAHVPQRIGGLEMFARELSCQLGDAGWRVVFCFFGEPTDTVRRFLDMPNMTIEAMPDSNRRNRSVIRNTARLLRRYRPDILHLYFVDSVSLCPWLARSHSVHRIFLTDQNSRPEDHDLAPSAWWRRTARQALNWPMSGVIAASDYIARSCNACGLVRDGFVTRIYNGVDLTRQMGDGRRFRAKYCIPENRRIVLQVSWMIPEKGIPDLLDAAKLVLGADTEAHFVIAGDGPCRQPYMEYAAKAGIADRVTWTGLLEDPLSDGVYGAADVVCQLSRWQEAFCWTIAEAMACRKPVVATGVGAIPEVVRDGVSGFLVPSRQPVRAAQRILQLLGDAPLRQQMGDAGRARVEELFDLRRNVAELIALYGISG
jgi:glycosyltransferase involved in cell wall biosynthesis